MNTTDSFTLPPASPPPVPSSGAETTLSSAPSTPFSEILADEQKVSGGGPIVPQPGTASPVELVSSITKTLTFPAPLVPAQISAGLTAGIKAPSSTPPVLPTGAPSLSSDTGVSVLSLAPIVPLQKTVLSSTTKPSQKNEEKTKASASMDIIAPTVLPGTDLLPITAQLETVSVAANSGQFFPGAQTLILSMQSKLSGASEKSAAFNGATSDKVNATTEKNSLAPALQGIFIQTPGESSSPRHVSATHLLAPGLDIGQLLANQPFTSNFPLVSTAGFSLNNGGSGKQNLSGTGSALVSTTMTASPKLTDLFSITNLANPFLTGSNLGSQTTAPLVTLTSNMQFEGALKHIIQVAEKAPESAMPQRISLELQTPPGAIVNVTVSRQNDQWRTQFSTSDPQALSWLQDKIGLLRQSSDFSPEIKWLPPQMEDSAFSNNPGQEQRQTPQPPRYQPQSEDNDDVDFLNILTTIRKV